MIEASVHVDCAYPQCAVQHPETVTNRWTTWVRAPRFLPIALVIGLSVAHAQESDQLEPIVVTAQKRAENLKDVPVSISQISGDALQLGHIDDYDDLTRAIPGVSFAAGGSGNGVGEGLTTIEMRGISSTVGAAVVGVYLDEVPITVKNTYDGVTQPLPFDIARVEVLRGPQGTLYGASSEAGAIRFITNQPKLDTDEYRTTADVSGTNYGGINYDTSAVANVALTPGVAALRVGVDYGRDAGWIDHYYPDGTPDAGTLVAKGVNTQWHGAIKIAALIEPSSTLSVTPALWLQRVVSNDSPVFQPSLGLYDQAKYVAEPSDDRLIIPSLTIVDNLSFADLTSVTSYFDRKEIRTTDGTYFNDYSFAVNYLDITPPFNANIAQNDAIIANIPSPVAWNTHYKQYAQELRLSSKTDKVSPIKWTAGLYGAHQRIDHVNSEYSPGLNSAFQSIYGYPLSSPIVQNALGSGPSTFDNDLIFLQVNTEEITQYAAFGQFEYDILSTLHAAAGLRYETASASNSVNTAGYYGIGIPTPFYASGRFNSTTPRFSLTYDLTDESTLYATVGKGYRLGAGNTPDPAGPNNLCSRDYATLGLSGAPTTYKSDSLWSYELGTKATLAERTVAVRAAGYFIKWDDIQQTIVLPTCGFNLTGNFGDAHSYGGELEVDYKPPYVPSLTLGVTSGSTHSTITRSADPGIVSVGEHVLYVPDWTATFHGDYHWRFGDSRSIFVRSDYAWTGKSYGSYQVTNPNYVDPSYGVVNGSLGFETDSLQFSVYGKNLADNRTIIQRPQVNNSIEGYAVRPLTVGVFIAKRF